MYKLLGSMRKVATLLNVSLSTVCRWVHHPQQKQYQRRQPAATKAEQVVGTLRACLAADPLVSLEQMTKHIQQVLSISVSKELVRCVLKKDGFSRKRARFYGRPKDLPIKTAAFLAARDRYMAEGRRFASLDETSFGRNSNAIVKGYSKRGTALQLERRPAWTKTLSVLAAVDSCSGTLMHVQRSGSFDTASFVQFVQQLSLPRGTVLLLDNVRFHHAANAKQAAAEKGYELLYVPPYSPWFNPVELVFSIVKRHYYKHHDVQAALGAVTTQHVTGAFRHSLAASGAV